MKKYINLINEEGKIKKCRVKPGRYSIIFLFLRPLFRLDIKNFIIQYLCCAVSILTLNISMILGYIMLFASLALMLSYNEKYIKDLLKKGYKPYTIEDEEIIRYHFNLTIENTRLENEFDITEHNDSYIVFDFETTGLSYITDEITEIGAIKVKNGHVIGTFQTLVKPKNQISQKITDITGITNEMVANKPTIEEVLPSFIDFIEGLPLVAHNAKFDYSFLNENYKRIYGNEFISNTYCTMEMYRSWYKENYSKNAPSAKLGDVVLTLLGNDSHLNYLKNAHRGLNDAEFTQKVYEKIVSYNNDLYNIQL